jgi:anti-sigma B factor antagonist
MSRDTAGGQRAAAASNRVVVGPTEPIPVIAPEGELDMATAPALKRQLTEFLRGDHRGVVIDLSAVTFIDSTAVGVMVGAQRALPEGQRLALVCSDPAVLRIFEITGLDGVFAIYPTAEAALQWVEGSESA